MAMISRNTSMIIRKTLCVFLYALLIVSLLINLLPLETSAQQTSQVHNLNKDEDYETIQQAINAASVGDVIYVGNGTYPEQVVVNKTVSLLGEDRFNTIIDGGGNGNVIFITADNVTVTGFSIQNSGSVLTLGGVYINHTVNNKITGNIIKNNEYGVYLSYSSENSIVNNTVFNNYYGMSLTSSTSNIISHNNLFYNNHGIWLSAYSVNNIFSENDVSSNLIEGIYVSESPDNTFSDNRVSNNTNGFHIITSTDNNIFGNNVSMNQQALFLSASSFNTFSRNNVFLNNYGVLLGGSSENLFSDNYIKNNGNSFRIVTSHNNTIYHNSFVNTRANTTQKPYIIESVDFWDNGVEGNHWSAFNGSDENEDGISDTSYVIDEINTDNYPLMAPFTSFQAVMGTRSYTVDIICNSSISEFEYLYYAANRTSLFSFQVSGITGNVFCRITIPHLLIDPPYIVTANYSTSLHSRIVHSNATHSWLYFKYYSGSNATIIGLSSFEQPIWHQLWFWAVIGLIVIVAILFFLIIRYRVMLSRQKKLIEAYELDLQKRFEEHLEATRTLFKADVKRRKSKIEMFRKKYNLEIRPRDSFEEVIGASEFKKEQKKKETN